MTHLGPSLRRTRKRARPWARAGIAVAVSLLANALLLREVRVGFLTPRRVEAPRSVTLAPLSTSQWEANRRATGATPPGQSRPNAPPPLAVIPAPPPPPPPPQAPGQVVDVAPSKDSTPPKDSRFVSDRDNTVAKETRSRHAKPGYENTAPVPTDPKASPPPAAEKQVAAGEGGKQGGRRPGESVARPQSGGARGAPSQPARDRLALAPAPNGEVARQDAKPGLTGEPGPLTPNAAPPSAAPGDGQAGRAGKLGPLSSLSLHPSAATYDRLAGGPAPDHLDGVEEGEGTYLNTREWKYAGYFNRIKQAVATQWAPNDALRERDPTGERFAYKDRITIVSVRLDDAGSLKDVAVEKSSGVDFLDRTALDAFRKAQPFVNPPRGLAQNGEIAFSFGFYLEVGSGLHIFRGPALPR